MSPSPRGLALAAVAITAAVFARALAGGFAYDDELLIVRNPAVTAPQSLWDLIAQPLWPDHAFWRPLTALLLCAGYHAGSGTALAIHALSVALHAASVAGAFALA